MLRKFCPPNATKELECGGSWTQWIRQSAIQKNFLQDLYGSRLSKRGGIQLGLRTGPIILFNTFDTNGPCIYYASFPIFYLCPTASIIQMVTVILVFVALITPVCCIFPKMVSEPAFHGKPLAFNQNDNAELIASSSYVTFGPCHHSTSLQVPISGGSGRGVIISLSSQLSILNLSLAESSKHMGTVGLDNPVAGSVAFSMLPPDRKAFPFTYQNVGDNGTLLEISCEQSSSTDILVMVQDDSKVIVNARVDFDESGGQRVKLDSSTNLKSDVVMKGMSKGKSKKQVAKFRNASKTGITIHHDKPGGVAIVQTQVRDPRNGKVVHRSIVTETRQSSSAIQPLGLLESKVDDDGDVVIKFQPVRDSNQPLKVDARIGIVLDHTDTHKPCVDVSAIVEDHTLVVNNGWIRQCLNESGFTNQTTGWDVVVLNGTVTDPNDGYRVLARLEDVETTDIRNQHAAMRLKLASPPLSTKITKEMREGRKPRDLKHRSLRAQQQPQPPRPGHSVLAPVKAPQHPPQQQNQKKTSASTISRQHRKVLVYGYCAKSTEFPTSQFTDYVAFSDPSGPASWSHDTFARKIANFTSNLGGCGCIAHSQGGAACLHLKTYYHSCLDTPSVKGYPIQSVGTPYQGTAVAGTLASLGRLFGVGCGYNADLTYSGAQSWLSNIPSWARSQVYYYTTSFSGFFCTLASEFVLSDPNDGVTEMSMGQLVGGNNMGNTQGWCHIAGMQDPAQCLDSHRNAVMNAAAQY